MKLFSALLVAALAVSTPILAEPSIDRQIPKKAQPSEQYLAQGLIGTTVCIKANMSMIQAINAMVKAMQAEEPGGLSEDNRKIALQAISDSNDLTEIVDMERYMAQALLYALIEDHHRSQSDLLVILDKASKAADQEMADAFKDLTSYQEMKNAFMPKLDACSNLLEKMVSEIKNNEKGIDKPK